MSCDRNFEQYLSVREVCSLLGVNKSTVKRRIDNGRYPNSLTQGNGGTRYQVPLSSLPPDAQHQYLSQQIKQRPPAERRAELQRLNLPEREESAIARKAGVTSKPRRPVPLPLTAQEANAKRLAFEQLPPTSIAEAQRRYEIMCALAAFDPPMPLMQRYQALSAECGESVSTLQRWQRAIRGRDRRDWTAFLAPDWRGGRPLVEMSDPAWQFILDEWLVQSKPALLPIFRRAAIEATRLGWRLPSYPTIKRRINALPEPHRVSRRPVGLSQTGAI